MKKKICVFCSSSDVADDVYFKAAKELGYYISNSGYSLLFGGANVGLMKHLNETVKEYNGYSIGVIPQKIFDNNLACTNVDELTVTPDMHTRKAKLESLADAYIALPGGFGTLEELSEVITLKQLGYHNKPIIILNINNFYEKLSEFYEELYSQKFAKEDYRKLYYFSDSIKDTFRYIDNYKEEKPINKWYVTT